MSPLDWIENTAKGPHRELSPYLKSLLAESERLRIPREITAFANQSGEVTYRIGEGFVKP